MTKLLAPEMFGLMSIAILISVGISLFTDIGLGPNVIQSKKSSDPEFMDAIWTIQILKGLFIWGLMIFLVWSFMCLSTTTGCPLIRYMQTH